MNVTSYLEAFLTIYGWEFYYILFLLLMLTGLFLYPLLRSFCAIYIDYLGNPNRKNDAHLYEMLTTLGLSMFIFFMALIPMVPADLNQTKVKSVCSKEEGKTTTITEINGNVYFKETKTRIPVLPWLAIMLGQGVNGVIYNTAPCALDVTEAQKAIWNSSLEINGEMLHEYERFKAECHDKIVEKIKYWRSGVDKTSRFDGDKTAQEMIKDEIDKAYDENHSWEITFRTEQDDDLLVYGLDSRLHKNLFYNPGTEYYQEFRAAEPVDGFTGDDGNGNMSEKNPPTCGDWWLGQGGHLGLRVRMAATLSDATIWQIAVGENRRGGISECRKGVKWDREAWTYVPTEETLKSCRVAVVRDMFENEDSKYVEQLLTFDQGKVAKDTTLTGQDKSNMTLAVAGAVGLTLLAKFTDIDLTGGVLGTITSFYASLYMLKLLLKHLLPMILMTVYMFWGIYMVLGRMAMDAVIKGMILIFSLTIIPGIWAVMEHLDDSLWKAMYNKKDDTNVFDIVLLDAASSAFYMASIMVVFYLVNMADGVNAGSAVKDSHQGANSISSSLGQTAGGAAAKAGGKVAAGARNLASRAGRGIKGGIKKLFSK